MIKASIVVISGLGILKVLEKLPEFYSQKAVETTCFTQYILVLLFLLS